MGQKLAEEASGPMESLALPVGTGPVPDGSRGNTGVRSATTVGWDGKLVQGSCQHGKYPASMALLGKHDPSRHGEELKVMDRSV